MFNHDLEARIKRLEEEISWMHRDMANLINIIENYEQEPEIHFHYYNDFRTGKECNQSQSNDLNDFI